MSHVFLEDHPRSGGLLYPRVKVMLFINSQFFGIQVPYHTNAHFAVSNGELSGYRLIYVWTYYTKRKEKEGGEGRGKKGIYIYKIYRVNPFLSAGVVAMRQLALLYMLVYSLHALIRARTHIYAYIYLHIIINLYTYVHTYLYSYIDVFVRMYNTYI